MLPGNRSRGRLLKPEQRGFQRTLAWGLKPGRKPLFEAVDALLAEMKEGK